MTGVIIEMRALLIIVSVLATACASDPTQIAREAVPVLATARVTISDGETFRLRPNEVAVTADRALFVTFQGIESDSRCPIDVTCVWSGNAAAIVGSAREGGEWTWRTLNTGIDPAEASVAGFIIRLMDVEPVARDGQVIRPENYSAFLRITRQ
jgi:hypothetical protein